MKSDMKSSVDQIDETTLNHELLKRNIKIAPIPQHKKLTAKQSLTYLVYLPSRLFKTPMDIREID